MPKSANSFKTSPPVTRATRLNKTNILRHPGIEPGPHRWQRRILTTELMALKLKRVNRLRQNRLLRAPGIEPGTYCV